MLPLFFSIAFFTSILLISCHSIHRSHLGFHISSWKFVWTLSMSSLNALFILLGVFNVFFHICLILSGMKPLVIARRYFPSVVVSVLSFVSTFWMCSVGTCTDHAFSILLLTFE